MSKHGVQPTAETWDTGARVTIFGAVDTRRYATCGALKSGRAMVAD
jgi:hypothetical protein